VKNFLVGTSVMCAIMVVALTLRAMLLLTVRVEMENAQAQAEQEPAKQAEYSTRAQRSAEMPCQQQPWWTSGYCVAVSGSAA
jgi:hypothetical protein